MSLNEIAVQHSKFTLCCIYLQFLSQLWRGNFAVLSFMHHRKSWMNTEHIVVPRTQEPSQHVGIKSPICSLNNENKQTLTTNLSEKNLTDLTRACFQCLGGLGTWLQNQLGVFHASWGGPCFSPCFGQWSFYPINSSTNKHFWMTNHSKFLNNMCIKMNLPFIITLSAHEGPYLDRWPYQAHLGADAFQSWS